MCDRPGCYEPPKSSGNNKGRYCSDECRKAMEQVLDRERKWRQRSKKSAEQKRGAEYKRRKEQQAAQASGVPQNAPSTMLAVVPQVGETPSSSGPSS